MVYIRGLVGWWVGGSSVEARVVKSEKSIYLPTFSEI